MRTWVAGQRTMIEDAAKLITIVSALTAAGQYIFETKDRRLERLYRTWDVVGRAAKDTVNGARNAALEDLAEHGFPLGGIQLSSVTLRSVNLRAAELRGADLRRADLGGAQLDRATLAGANMEAATLVSSSLVSANLSTAILIGSEFRKAILVSANLEGADLQRAVLVGADLSYANAIQADLRDAKLTTANLTGANFSRADLRGASLAGVRNWKRIKCLRRANIARVADAPRGFVEWAVDTMGAVAEPTDSLWEDVKFGLDTPTVSLVGRARPC